jgi:hypothetical protein
MLILEFSQYDKYLSDKEFMKYFNTLKGKVLELYPEINPNLELIIDRIYNLYFEGKNIDDAIHNLYYGGHIIKLVNMPSP